MEFVPWDTLYYDHIHIYQYIRVNILYIYHVCIHVYTHQHTSHVLNNSVYTFTYEPLQHVYNLYRCKSSRILAPWKYAGPEIIQSGCGISGRLHQQSPINIAKMTFSKGLGNNDGFAVGKRDLNGSTHMCRYLTVMPPLQ